jgi:transcription termination factor Rho
MEVHLDRRLADRRTFPAIDIERSGTRREELLMDSDTLRKAWLLRRMVSMISSDSANFAEAMERLLDRMKRTKTNAEFLATLNQGI